METLASVPGSHKLGMPMPNLQEPGTEAMETSVLFDTSHCCGHIGIHANYRRFHSTSIHVHYLLRVILLAILFYFKFSWASLSHCALLLKNNIIN